MKVIELLEAYEDHKYCDVVILDGSTMSSNGYGEDDILATWEHREHNHWYMGQLGYLNTLDPNPLAKWFGYRVKSFTVLNDFNLNGIECMYITI